MAGMVLLGGPLGSGKSALYRSHVRQKLDGLPRLDVEEVLYGPEPADTRAAAWEWLRAERQRYLEAGYGFVTETRMDQVGETEFLHDVRKRDYSIRLILVGVGQELALERIRCRDGELGGPEIGSILRDRHQESLERLGDALAVVDDAVVLDNSDLSGHRALVRACDGRVEVLSDDFPEWAKQVWRRSGFSESA